MQEIHRWRQRTKGSGSLPAKKDLTKASQLEVARNKKENFTPKATKQDRGGISEVSLGALLQDKYKGALHESEGGKYNLRVKPLLMWPFLQKDLLARDGRWDLATTACCTELARLLVLPPVALPAYRSPSRAGAVNALAEGFPAQLP